MLITNKKRNNLKQSRKKNHKQNKKIPRIKTKSKMKRKSNKGKKKLNKVFKLLLTSVGAFKAYRRVLFFIGKTLKYSIWASILALGYHLYLVKKVVNPEERALCNMFFLGLAKSTDWWFYDLKILLTRPPVEKLLPDRPPLPPGAAFPKTLVLNLRGTLVHSEYKFGVGFEIYKRPGLSVFLQRMSRYYEIVIFGDEENGIVNDICEALDPNA